MPRKLGDIVGFDVTIRVPIFIALVALALVLISAYILFPNAHDAVTFIALALTAVATIGGTFYVAETLRAQGGLEETRAEQQRKAHEADKADQRRSEAFALIARWNSPELFHARKATAQALQVFQQPATSAGGEKGVRELIDKNEDIRHNARHVLNFFEEVALSVRLGQSDEETVSEAFAGLVLRSYRTYRGWIEENRDTTGRQKMWIELQNLAEKWAKR